MSHALANASDIRLSIRRLIFPFFPSCPAVTLYYSSSTGGGGAKTAKTAAQMRLTRAAADKTQQRLGFSSLSAINKDKADAYAAKKLRRAQQQSGLSATKSRNAAPVPVPEDTPCSARGAVDVGMIEADDPMGTSEEETEPGSFSAMKRPSVVDETCPQPQLKRLRVGLRSGQEPFLKFGNKHAELRTGQNLLSLVSSDQPILIAAGTPRLPEPGKEFLAVYVSERNDAVLMSSTNVGPEVSVCSDSHHEPAHLHPHIPIILADGDTIELRER